MCTYIHTVIHQHLVYSLITDNWEKLHEPAAMQSQSIRDVWDGQVLRRLSQEGFFFLAKTTWTVIEHRWCPPFQVIIMELVASVSVNTQSSSEYTYEG